MKALKSFSVNKSVKNNYSVICQTCKVTTKHKVLTSANEEGRAEMPYDETYFWNNEYEIIQCLGCETISFRLEHTNSEDYYGYDEEPHSDVQIYPKRSESTWHIKSFFNVPNNLRRIYRETIDCYNSDSLTLCGAGVRALVEGLCKVNGIEKGTVEYKNSDGTITTKNKTNLQGKINGLYEQGKLTKDNAEILHEHRFLGNTAIHELNSPSKDELVLAIEIIENVFDTLYEIPNKANELKMKRLMKQKKNNA